MKLTDLARHLQAHGCILVRDRGKHSVYCNAARDRFTAVPRHREINTCTAKISVAIWAFRSRSGAELLRLNA